MGGLDRDSVTYFLFTAEPQKSQSFWFLFCFSLTPEEQASHSTGQGRRKAKRLNPSGNKMHVLYLATKELMPFVVSAA